MRISFRCLTVFAVLYLGVALSTQLHAGGAGEDKHAEARKQLKEISDKLKAADDAIAKLLKKIPEPTASEMKDAEYKKKYDKLLDAIKKFGEAIDQIEPKKKTGARSDQKSTPLAMCFPQSIGADIEGLPYNLPDENCIGSTPGLIVRRIVPNSPAAQAKLCVNDFILAMDGRVTTNAHEFARCVSAATKDVSLIVKRGKRLETVTVKRSES